MDDLIRALRNTDIYLIDQILKGRFNAVSTILDAGCGYGRNMQWFIENNFRVYGIDQSQDAIEQAELLYPEMAANFKVGGIEMLPFADLFFDYVISNAVLHFAKGEAHFYKMVAEMVRVLKPEGNLFIRMASDLATPQSFEYLHDGIYRLRDGDERFLLNRNLLENLVKQHRLRLIEPVKTTNVANLRCMTTLVFEKV
jgi:tellurite methyltransferase